MRYFVMFAAVALLVSFVWWKVDRDARQSVLDSIERANTRAGTKADQAEIDVLKCRGTWNRETHKCE